MDGNDVNIDEQVIDSVSEKVERMAIKSKQPRFTEDAEQIYGSLIKWLTEETESEPDYAADSRRRDRWLSEMWRKEPHISGVLNSAVLLDANRGWSFIGGRNQVNRYVNIMHSLDNGKGYRYYMRKQALAYRTADIGAISEIGREGKRGPLRMLYDVDPTRCELMPSFRNPLKYHPSGDDAQKWGVDEFFRVVSMPSILEEMYGLGYCGLSRAIDLVLIALGVVKHDQEKLRARTMDGLLLLQGIGEKQWRQAMQVREAELSAKEREYFGGVFVLAGIREIKAELMQFSQLPDNFDREMWTNLLMYGLALCFGYSPDEFWPVSHGALGRGTEAELQHRKASGKGGMDFVVMWGEEFSKRIPASLLFEFDERDLEGELLNSQLNAAKAQWVIDLYTAETPTAQGLIDRDEARSLLVTAGLIPEEWTLIEEDVEVTDEEMEARKRRYLDLDRVQRAAYNFPQEPIVRYSFPDEKMQVILPYGGMLKRTAYSIPKRRQDEVEVLYENDEVTITEDDVIRSIDQAGRRTGDELEELLQAEVVSGDEDEEERSRLRQFLKRFVPLFEREPND